jgi:hypothetical protein
MTGAEEDGTAVLTLRAFEEGLARFGNLQVVDRR